MADAAAHPPNPDLEWHLIIEELADSPHIETALLRGFIKMIPDLAAAAPGQIRERVALRVLEESVGAGPDDATEPSAAPGSSVDVSQSAEAVLRRFYQKKATMVPVLEKYSIDQLNNEIRLFVLQKRSTMPKSSLCLLKEYIEDENCTPFSFLRQHNAWIRQNQDDHIHGNAGSKHERARAQRLCMNGAENSLHGPGSAACTIGSGPKTRQKEPSGAMLHPMEQTVSDGDRFDCPQGDVIGIQNIRVQVLENDPMPEPPVKENMNSDKHGTQPIAQNAAASIAPADDDGCNAISHKGLSGTMHLPRQNILKDTATSERLHKSNSLPSSLLRNARKEVNPTLNGKDGLHGRTGMVPKKPTGDASDDVSSEFESLGQVIANEKKHLLSSLVQANHDSDTGECTEQGLCIKCDRGGQVLSCSAIGCVITVHKHCLVQTIKFDETDCFYCPFCTHKMAFKAYSDAKKCYLQAMKNLSAFLGKDTARAYCKKTSTQNCHLRVVDNQEMEVANNGNNPKRPTTMDIANVGVCDASNNTEKIIKEKISGGVVITAHNPVDVNDEHQWPAEPHEANNGGYLYREEGNNNGNLCHEERDRSGEESSGFLVQQEGGMSPGDNHLTSRPLKSQHVKKSASNDAADSQSFSSQQNGRKRRRIHDTGGINHPKKTSESRNCFTSSPAKKRNNGNQPKRYSNPLLYPGRRTKLSWTEEEEELLKKGIEVMGLNTDGSRPWRRILEFGQGVFHKTRLPQDLRVKWRNMAKQSKKK